MGEVSLSPGTPYYLEVNRPVGASTGANDFWLIKLATSDSLNPQEQDDEANATSAGAEATYVETDPDDPTETRRYLGGQLPAGDIDWWSLTANAGDQIVVLCASRRVGSGVADMKVELFADPSDPAVQSETESATTDLVWSDSDPGASMPAVTATPTGTHYLKLGATSMVPNGAVGTHYLCGVHTFAP